MRIRPLENGPVEVSGVVLMVDAAGQAAPPSESAETPGPVTEEDTFDPHLLDLLRSRWG